MIVVLDQFQNQEVSNISGVWTWRLRSMEVGQWLLWFSLLGEEHLSVSLSLTS